MIVDAHHHLWDPARRDYPWLASAALAPICRSYTMHDLRSAADQRVTATILVQTVPSLAETEEFLRIALESNGPPSGAVPPAYRASHIAYDPQSRTSELNIAYDQQPRIEPLNIAYDQQPSAERPNIAYDRQAAAEVGIVYDRHGRAGGEPHIAYDQQVSRSGPHIVYERQPGAAESNIVYDRQLTVVGVVGWVELADPSVVAVLERLRSLHGGQLLVGIRHQAEDEPDPDWLLRPKVIRGLAAVAEAGLVYDLLVRAPQRAAALTVADTLPHANLVLDHAGKPGIATGEWEPWASWITAMAARPNVTCKLSGLITEADWHAWSAGTIRRYADHVLTSFGADRVMFGSDWPVCELAGSYAAVLDLVNELIRDADNTERDAILGGTARRVYRI